MLSHASLVSSPVTSFLAVVFDTAAAAESALPAVHALGDGKDVCVRDAAVVIRTEGGRIELQQTREIAPGEAIVGVGSAGLVAGLLLGLPVGGALLGLAGRRTSAGQTSPSSGRAVRAGARADRLPSPA
jgi:uncharacterized membrane protein